MSGTASNAVTRDMADAAQDRFQGTIDFSRLPPPGQPLSTQRQSSASCIRAPGVEWQWNPRFTDVAFNDHVWVLASGRPRELEQLDGANPASSWLQEYVRHGARRLDKMGGAFSVVILDLANRRLALVVDRFSIETLCYRSSGAVLSFADKAKRVPGARDIDAQGVYDFFYFHVIPAPRTVFRDVRRVPPAHVVTVSPSSIDAKAYWEPSFVEDDRSDLGERKRRFRALVQHSVAEEADEPATACFLSGGTDSSTIAGMLTLVRGEPAHAYSIGFDVDDYDEMEYARIAARHFGLVHRELYLTAADLVSGIPAMAASFDQPFGNSSALPAYFCALHARQDGFTRMLAGDGGDELFGGNSRYATQKLFQFYHGVPPGLRSFLERQATRSKLFAAVPGFRQLGGYVRHARLPMPDRLESYNLLHRLGEHTLFEPAFTASIDTHGPLRQQQATWNAVRCHSLVNRMLAYDWKYTLADSDLPKIRSAAQLADVGVSYPLLGRALTDFSLSIPADWKLNGIRLRWFFKEALRDFLPREILRKKKHGFGLPFGHWTLRHAGLRRLVEDSLQGIAERGIVRGDFTRDLMSRLLPEAPGYYGEMVWLLVMLEQWLQAHDSGWRATGSSLTPLRLADG